jgi:hypothetical protein
MAVLLESLLGSTFSKGKKRILTLSELKLRALDSFLHKVTRIE